MKKYILPTIISVLLASGTIAAQSASSDAYLNSLDLNFSQYNERMGLSLWIFNQSMAQAGMGAASDVTAKGAAIIKAGKANVTYRPAAPTLAEVFAASRTKDATKRRELIETYNLYLSRFRDAQREDGSSERDLAATLSLAFASYFEIYSNGQKTSAAQDIDTENRFRQSLLKNAYFQGTNDRYRQLLDENTAVQTVVSLVTYRSAVQRGDKAVIEESRQQALAFLDFYWSGDEEQAKKIRLTAAGFRD